MKLKKILAMVLTIAMALSVCSVTALAADVNVYVGGTQQLYTSSQSVSWASSNTSVATVNAGLVTGVSKGIATITATDTLTSTTVGTWSVNVSIDTSKPITSVTAQTRSLTVPYGTSPSTVETMLDSILLTATYQGQGVQTATANNWTSDPNYDPYYRGDYVFRPLFYNAVSGASIDTITVTVGVAPIDVDFGGATLEVPYGTSEYLIAGALPESATVKIMSGSTVLQTETWEIGDEFTDWKKYSGNIYATDLSPSLKGNYSYDSADLQLSVVTKTSFSLADLTTSMTYSGDYYSDEIELDYIVSNMLEDQFYDWDVDIVSVDVDGNYMYGDVYNGDYALDIDYNSPYYNSLMAGYKLTEEVPFIAQDYNGNRYYGDINITITSGIRDYTYKMGASEFEFEFGKWIAGKISADMVETLESVEFYIEDNYGGTMYADKDLNEFQEEEAYSYSTSSYNETSELEELYFVPDGTENYYELSYIAYGKYNEKLEGTITIECREFLMIRGTVGTDEYLTFDSDDFVEMIANSSYDDYELISIDSLKVTGGGKLYYDYDEESNRNTAVSNRTDYFVDASKDNCIDYISYVPAANAESGTVTVTFKLYLKDGNKSQSPTGIYQINVIEKADITVQTGIGQQVKVDMDLFEEYLKDNVSTSKANYEMVYITFKNAPAAKNEGYLYADGDKITSPDDKKFYTEDKKDGDYPAYDLVFVGGNTAKTTQAQFTIYGKRNANSTPTKLVEGSIDFIVGTAAANSLSGAIKAAETMSFATSLSAFEAMGNNDNEYITFTSLPVGGKLVYGWGTASQEDVRIGTEYYLSYKAGQKMLSNVTFVPSYSSSKIAKTITIGVQGYNEKDRAVTGTVNITVTYAANSKQFTDVTTNTYADSVDFLLNQGITTGATPYTFTPPGNVKRAEFVTFLWRAAGKPEPSAYVTNKFTDVKNSGEYQYAYKAILWAVENGITTGTTATTFSPAANVTHEQLIAFLYRYDVNLLGHAGTGSYTVSYAGWSSVPQYAQAPAKWAAYKGILTDSTTYPTTAGTRATVALWLHRMLTL